MYVIIILNKRSPFLSLFFGLIYYFKVFEYFSFPYDLFIVLLINGFIDNLGILWDYIFYIIFNILLSFLLAVILPEFLWQYNLLMHFRHLLYITSNLLKSILIVAFE